MYDEVTNEAEDTGAICVKLTFLNTNKGNETRLLKENDFKVLLSKSDYVNILSNKCLYLLILIQMICFLVRQILYACNDGKK